jgi:hypothetical protein
MRDDRTLHKLALRIQLCAERRCGELLKQIPLIRPLADTVSWYLRHEAAAEQFTVLYAVSLSRKA